MHSKSDAAAVFGSNTIRHVLSKTNICLSFFDLICQFSRCSPRIGIGTGKSEELPAAHLCPVRNLGKTF